MIERWALRFPTRAESSQYIGEALKQRARAAAAEDGVQAVARRLRKGGWPDPGDALRILGIRSSRAT